MGCEDGASRIFSYENGGLEFVKAHPTTGSRILSLAYHPVKSELFLGCADGTVRCVEADSGRSKFRITGDLMRGATTLIWSLIVLSDSTVVTGDNRGHVQLWDGEGRCTYDLFSSAYSRGVGISRESRRDTSVRFRGRQSCDMYKAYRITASFWEFCCDRSRFREDNLPGSWQWVYTTSHRPHSHDVYALTVCTHANSFKTSKKKEAKMIQQQEQEQEEQEQEQEQEEEEEQEQEEEQEEEAHKKEREVLLSGESIASCVSTALQTLLLCALYMWVLPVPAKGIASASASCNVIALRHRRRLDIWALTLDREGSEAGADNCQLALRLEMQGQEHIQCSCLSPNGIYLVSSSKSNTRMWLLKQGDGRNGLKLLPIKLPDRAKQGCLAMTFSEDSTQLAISASEGTILLLKLEVKIKNGNNDVSRKRSPKKPKKNEMDAKGVRMRLRAWRCLCTTFSSTMRVSRRGVKRGALVE